MIPLAAIAPPIVKSPRVDILPVDSIVPLALIFPLAVMCDRVWIAPLELIFPATVKSASLLPGVDVPIPSVPDGASNLA